MIQHSHMDMNLQAGSDTPISGLSGNEMYCLDKIGYEAGQIAVGNSVYSLGFIRSVGSGIRSIAGGEISAYTELIGDGRRQSLERFRAEASKIGAVAATGLTTELITHGDKIEFLSVGSTLQPKPGHQVESFTSSADGQELYCQVDAGYQPKSFAFGNVAYSIGVGSGIRGSLRTLKKGEIREYSESFGITRNLALERIVADAASEKANSVVGIRTTILPTGHSSAQEMIMIGTASYNPQIEALSRTSGITSSDLTAEETWNVAALGYAPVRLVLGTSIYSLGIAGGIKAALKGMRRGEINELTEMVYEARDESFSKLQQQARTVQADKVLGVKTHIYSLGSDIIEFLAIGTAVKKVHGVDTKSANLLPQAIIRDKDTFINTADYAYGQDLQQPEIGADES